MSKSTKIEYVTEDYLVRGLLADMDLSMYGCIIVDEAHERNVSTDLLLGILKAKTSHMKDLRVIVTSATLEKELFMRYLGGCKSVEIPGRTFPVEISYNPRGSFDDPSSLIEGAIKQCLEIHLQTPISSGDILCFLTGQDEVFGDFLCTHSDR